MIPSKFSAGDMLNYFMAGERLLVFYQLDVAGHGIPAALLSVTRSVSCYPDPEAPFCGRVAMGQRGARLRTRCGGQRAQSPVSRRRR